MIETAHARGPLATIEYALRDARKSLADTRLIELDMSRGQMAPVCRTPKARLIAAAYNILAEAAALYEE